MEDKVKAKNPGKEVTVGDDGTATVKDPTTGITHTIPGTDLVNQDFEPVIPADKIPVKDPANLTQEEQDKVKESVEKSNPGKKVTVDKTGKVTITDPNTNISHEIPGEKLITLDLPVVVIPEYTEPIGTTGVDDNGNLIEPLKPEGNANNQSTSTARVEKSTKRLANTGEAETNTGLAGLGLGVLGSLLAVAKRRKKDEK